MFQAANPDVLAGTRSSRTLPWAQNFAKLLPSTTNWRVVAHLSDKAGRIFGPHVVDHAQNRVSATQRAHLVLAIIVADLDMLITTHVSIGKRIVAAPRQNLSRAYVVNYLGIDGDRVLAALAHGFVHRYPEPTKAIRVLCAEVAHARPR